jgi:hypothetical protein
MGNTVMHWHRRRHVDTWPATRVRPTRIWHAMPRDVRPKLFHGHASVRRALDSRATVGGSQPATREALVEVLLVQADRLRHRVALRRGHGDHAAHSSDTRDEGKRGACAQSSVTLDNQRVSYPETDDLLVLALQRLLAREGGHVLVGKRAGISDQSLYQIAERKINSRTGKPNGVGPSIRRRLDAAYPGWFSTQAVAPEVALPSLPAALETLGIALAKDMPQDVRDDVADALEKLARRRGQDRDQQQVLHLLQAASGKRTAAGTP